MRNRWLFGLGAVAGAAAGIAIAYNRREAAERSARVERLRAAPASKGRRIVILGAGFGGINTAHSLLERLPAESGWSVTLVDRHNYHLFTPLLYHAATGLVEPSSVLYPVRSLSRAPHFRFREATIQGVDFQRQSVQLDDGELDYDFLVVALGSTTNFFGQEASLKRALTLKNFGDSVTIRNRLIDAFEAADIATDQEERRSALTFAVVGGGATGVELIGAMRGLIDGALPRQYPNLPPQQARLILFEALDRLLPGLPEHLTTYAHQRLAELGVEIRLGTPVKEVTEAGLTTADGEFIPARTVVWAAGVQPTSLVRGLNLPSLKNGRLQVNELLQVEGQSRVYALGDNAGALDPHTGKPLPPSAAVAVQQGKALAEILLARLEGRPAQPFRYQHRGELVSLGRHEAVAEVFGQQLTGFPAWLTWRAFYLSQLLGFRNQVAVALDWSFAYAYQRDTVRLDVPKPPAPMPTAEAEAPRPEVLEDAYTPVTDSMQGRPAVAPPLSRPPAPVSTGDWAPEQPDEEATETASTLAAGRA